MAICISAAKRDHLEYLDSGKRRRYPPPRRSGVTAMVARSALPHVNNDNARSSSTASLARSPRMQTAKTKKAPGASLRGLLFANRRRNYMVFGAVELLLGVVFFFAVFFLVLFLAVLFFAGAFLAGVVVGLVGVVEFCACAAYGTVDAPTKASRANAEINAFILILLRFLFGVRAGGRCRTCPGRTARPKIRANTNMFRRIGDKFHATVMRSSAHVARMSHAPWRNFLRRNCPERVAGRARRTQLRLATERIDQI
jgi:hypothetical protein